MLLQKSGEQLTNVTSVSKFSHVQLPCFHKFKSKMRKFLIVWLLEHSADFMSCLFFFEVFCVCTHHTISQGCVICVNSCHAAPLFLYGHKALAYAQQIYHKSIACYIWFIWSKYILSSWTASLPVDMYVLNRWKSVQFFLYSVLCCNISVRVNAVAMPLEVTWPFPQCPRLGWRISSRVIMGMVGSYSYLWTSESDVSPHGRSLALKI